eukprot:COSAG02_NODE_2593_length_8463_cov_4.133309_2_plen_84_part_00
MAFSYRSQPSLAIRRSSRLRKIRLERWPQGLMAQWSMEHRPQRRYRACHMLLGAIRTANSLRSRWLLLPPVVTAVKEQEQQAE